MPNAWEGSSADNKVCKVQPNSFKASTQEEEIPTKKLYEKIYREKNYVKF